jgi:putative transposase
MPGAVKLTVQVKLQPRPQQSEALRHTLETVNEACNWLSKKAWETQEFRQFPLHRAFYKEIRTTFDLTAQAVVRLIGKVANAYELDRDVRREFRKHGAIAYDARLLSWNMADSRVSLWSLDGRLDLPFVCGERQRELLAFQRGETDLVYRDEDWFLFTTVEVPDTKEREALDWLGCDFGIVNIVADSDGNVYSGSELNGP